MATHELLKNTLDTLSSTNVMLSWCIFHGKNGTITVRIRYNSNKESTNYDNDTYFRRKSTVKSLEIVKGLDAGESNNNSLVKLTQLVWLLQVPVLGHAV